MKPNSLLAVHQRRRALLERIGAERAVLRQFVEELAKPIAMADRGLAVARYLRARPRLGVAIGLAGGVAAAFLGRRVRRLGLARLSWLAGAVRLALSIERATRPRRNPAEERGGRRSA